MPRLSPKKQGDDDGNKSGGGGGGGGGGGLLRGAVQRGGDTAMGLLSRARVTAASAVAQQQQQQHDRPAQAEAEVVYDGNQVGGKDDYVPAATVVGSPNSPKKGAGGQILSMAATAASTVAATVTDVVVPRVADYVNSSSHSGCDSSSSDAETVFLHGVLHLDIVEARDLPSRSKRNRVMGKTVYDPYVTVDVCTRGSRKTHRVAKTRVVRGVAGVHPRWDESFRVDLCHESVGLSLDLKDDKVAVKSENLGAVYIRAGDLLGWKGLRGGGGGEEDDGPTIEGWFPLVVGAGSGGTADAGDGVGVASLRISVRFEGADHSSRTNEVPGCYFPLRRGCGVTLYQDADAPCLPPLTDVLRHRGDHGQKCPPRLWVDVAEALEGAERFIYVLGWAVKADMALVRTGGGVGDSGDDEGPSPRRGGEHLGEVLKRKARDGVRVLVMVWDEAMSNDVYPPGVMGTHDEETRRYFAGSGVEVVLAGRRKVKGKLRNRIFAMTTYTHHQKCVMVDAEIPGEAVVEGARGPHHRRRRRVVAFAGGIDLTDGRYDTPEHPLFRTIPLEEHRDDFYNQVCPATAATGPREPWHDVHMRVEGRAAIDLVTNFIERWRCQAQDLERRLLFLGEDEEFDLDWEPPPPPSTSPSLRPWNVQLFRSINSDSAQFDYNMLSRLPAKKGRPYDDSIQRAYIHHIRRARRFIYVENQYFLGSSHSWWPEPNTKSPHLIPVELATRIVRAIRAGEEFRVYVTIPLHPEGDPTSAAVQAILHFQHRTMEMMYGRIADAIIDVGIDAHPTDYLSFFCLGKREDPCEVPDILSEPEEGTAAWRARRSLRFMIYVHSKMAIFDDEYIIVGSANVNERSMNGNRDTELALGAYQEGLTKEEFGLAADIPGDVRTFRLSLWAEHCGVHAAEHMRPASAACMAWMRDMGSANLDRFLAEEPAHNESHIMVYPLDVTNDGKVKKKPECEEFPDLGGLVIGQYIHLMPDSVTS